MTQSHWLFLAFVATMVCNGNCRPREVDIRNIYPVYRSVKQLESQNRYEKPFITKQDADSVTYTRIDIPPRNDLNAREKLQVKNNSKSVVDYVPVALTIKKTNVKKWPSDQNGIETQDDLSLYNVYTSNINPLNVVPATTPSHNLDLPYISHSKPSILILEEATTPKPLYEYPEEVFSQNIQVENKPSRPGPPQRPFPPQDQYQTPNYVLPHRPGFGTTAEPFYVEVPNFQPPPQHYYPHTHTSSYVPGTPAHVGVPQNHFSEQTTGHVGYESSSSRPETTTEKQKNATCPNISVISTSSIHNNNSFHKEGCQDISIQIVTSVTNTNAGAPKPLANAPGVSIQNDQTTLSGGFGLLAALWALLARILSFTHTNRIFAGVIAPLSAFLAGGVGLSAVVLPWFFPDFLKKKKRQKNRVLVLKRPGSKSSTYFYRSLGDNSSYWKRTKRDLRELEWAYRGWAKGKKISRYRVRGQLGI